MQCNIHADVHKQAATYLDKQRFGFVPIQILGHEEVQQILLRYFPQRIDLHTERNRG